MGPKEVKALNKTQVEEWRSMCDRFNLDHIVDDLIGFRRAMPMLHMLAMGMSRGEWVAYAKAEIQLDTTDGMILWQAWADEKEEKKERADSARDRAKLLSVDSLSDAVLKKLNLPMNIPVQLEAQLLDTPLTGDVEKDAQRTAEEMIAQGTRSDDLPGIFTMTKSLLKKGLRRLT